MRHQTKLALTFGLLFIFALNSGFVRGDEFEDEDLVDETYDDIEVEDDVDVEAGQQPAQPQISREQLEAILTFVGEDCRNEMQTALGNEEPLSEKCRDEMRQAYMQYLQATNGGQMPSAGQPAAQPKAQGSSFAATAGVIVFLVSLVVGGAGYVIHFNKNIRPKLPGKSKSQIKRDTGKGKKGQKAKMSQ